MVTVYAPAGTTVMVCAGAPHNTLRVTIHAPAWTKVTIHAPAWTRVVVCAGTPNNVSMVTVYAPASTTVVVCAGTPHNKLRVHAPAWTKVVVCVGTPPVTISDMYRRRTRVCRRPLCCAPGRNVCCDTHASNTRFFPVGASTAMLRTGT